MKEKIKKWKRSSHYGATGSEASLERWTKVPFPAGHSGLKRSGGASTVAYGLHLWLRSDRWPGNSIRHEVANKAKKNGWMGQWVKSRILVEDTGKQTTSNGRRGNSAAPS